MNIYNERLEMKKLREVFAPYLVEKPGGTIAGTYELPSDAPSEIQEKYQKWLELRAVVREKTSHKQ